MKKATKKATKKRPVPTAPKIKRVAMSTDSGMAGTYLGARGAAPSRGTPQQIFQRVDAIPRTPRPQ